MIREIEDRWRALVAARCGGIDFGKPGTGYSFSAVLGEERRLSKGNISDKPESALLALSVADPTWKMPERAMMAALRYYNLCPDSTRYTDNAGIRSGNGTELGDTHEEIANFLNTRYPGLRYNNEIGADGIGHWWIQYIPGSIKRALAEIIPTAFFNEGDTLLFPVPGYQVIASLMNNRGIKVEEVVMQRDRNFWRIPFKEVELPRNGKVFLYLNLPHNPTGATYSDYELIDIVCWANENGVILIVDEAYNDLRYDNSKSILEIPGWENCAIVLQSVSKGWNATGLRFGWVVAHPMVIKAIRKVLDVKDSGLFGPSIAAALTCLRHPEWAEETRGKYQRLHAILANGLNEAGFKTNVPSAGLCQFTKAPKTADGHWFDSLIELVQWMRQTLRISVMHYEVNGEWCLRWAVTVKPIPECGLPDEESVIKEAVCRLGKVKFEF